MGKKPQRKKATFIPAGTEPPPPVDEDLGSLIPLTTPGLPGEGFSCLDVDGWDDGGVADLSLIIDLDDLALRRKKGDEAYFEAKEADTLPRAFEGQFKNTTRKSQKLQLAQLLFAENTEDEDKGPSEVFNATPQNVLVDGESDIVRQHRLRRLNQAKNALRLSLMLKEPGCASFSLSQMCLRKLGAEKDSGEAALRLANKALKIASDGFWDADAVVLEAEAEIPKSALERPANDIVQGLSHPEVLKHTSARVGLLCKRTAYLNKGNSLVQLKRPEEGRVCYEESLALLENEPRCSRVDWERHSMLINIGNTWNLTGDFVKAKEYFEKAQAIGEVHLTHKKGSKSDGNEMIKIVKKSLARALKQNGQDAEAKQIMDELVQQAIREKEEADRNKAEKEKEQKK